MDTQPASQAPAVDRAFDILEAVAAHPDGLTLSELSAQLDLPKNAVFRITRSLTARGYVQRHEETLRFQLTGRLLQLARPTGPSRTLTEVSVPLMRELRDATRETVQLGCRSGEGGVILEKLESLQPLRIAVDIGLRFAFHSNAPGKLLLAWLPEIEREAWLTSAGLTAATAKTITDADTLRRECERIRNRGYSTDFAEADEGIHCVAAPIRDRQEHLAAALWVSGPARRLPKERVIVLATEVMTMADRISARWQRS